MKKKLIIGAPTANRDWIIRDWLTHIDNSFYHVSDLYDLEIILVASDQDPSVKITDSFCKEYGYNFNFVYIDEPKSDDKRIWNIKRYERMVLLRNILLEEVRKLEPEYFLSLDTDILINPLQISYLLETIQSHPAAAVGGKTFMTKTGVNSPSYGMFIKHEHSMGIRRKNNDGVLKVDVIMAIKLMNKLAYNVDYIVHSHGEDLGWSSECKKQGLQLYWDGRIASKHVMFQSSLNELDKRVGF